MDVERAELEVLQGIEEADWPKIKQIAMEVHDLCDGNGVRRVHALQSMLQERGFGRITVDQEASMRGTDLYMMYATRG